MNKHREALNAWEILSAYCNKDKRECENCIFLVGEGCVLYMAGCDDNTTEALGLRERCEELEREE